MMSDITDDEAMVWRQPQRVTPAEDRPGWTRRVRWLWRQDDAVPREDTAEDAWVELFGGTLPRTLVPVEIEYEHNGTLHTEVSYQRGPHWIDHWDGGDCDFYLGVEGTVYLSSYPGNNAIGVVRGPGVVL